ncbi:MAG: hypothetical protein HYR94_04005 [Chloroflexi bacterium]|nr:hypothetical protein [Chloroflexota bacterium]
MLEEELPLEEQTKKKKRFILLVLFTLLLVTAGAAAFLEPSAPPSPTVANVEVRSPTPAESATRLANASTGAVTPQDVQGDEFSKPTPSPDSVDRTTPQAATLTAMATEKASESGATGNTSTREAVSSPTDAEVEATGRVTITPETTSKLATPPTEDGSETSPVVTPDPGEETEPVRTVTVVPKEGTPVAEVVPTAAEAPNNATPAAVATSRRVHEGWDILDGDGIEASSGAGTSEPVTSTAALTTTSTLSETMAVVPPDGLPVTGGITQRGMNWAAMAMVVLLLGAGALALFYPRPDRG